MRRLRTHLQGISANHRQLGAGRQKPPQAVIICLQLFANRLDFLGKTWRGFMLTPYSIRASNGDCVYATEINAMHYAMQSLKIERTRRCRMNENEKGIIEPLSPDKKPLNVTFIDKAPKKKKPIEFRLNINEIKKLGDA